jgi:signal transduction histidine kinase
MVTRLLWQAVQSVGADEETPVELPTQPNRAFSVRTKPIPDKAEAGTFLTIVRDVTDELARRASEEQQTRMAAVARMASGLAHDFRNLLTSIATSVTLLQRNDKASAPEQLLDLIAQAADQGVALSRRVLDVTGASQASPESIDIGVLVAVSLPMLRTLLSDTAQLVEEIDNGPMVARANRVQLVQALTNLVANANDAMLNGGRIRIRAHLDAKEGGIVLEVEDNGQGMTVDVAERAFDPYFTTKEAGRGTGLGLAQLQQALVGHGGKVWIDSKLAVGTTVTLWLPQSGEPPIAEAETPPQDSAGAASNDRLVWLVEDDELVATPLEIWLDRAGYSGVVFMRPLDVLRWLDNHAPPMAIVTDLAMPGISGVELIQQVRARVGPVPAVLSSGHQMDPATLPIEPPFEFVPKPLNLQHLEDVLYRFSRGAVSGRIDEGSR